jgi:SAM-dependent methyltransferase
MCPAHIRFCLAANRLAPPPAEDFSYCELGMGQGFSANLHAAGNDGDFVGMDFNPDHAAYAGDLARRAQSGLRVSDDSFETFLNIAHPGYDFVCLHGGWSWISEANRRRVVEFAQRHLRPGGVFYLSYNCHPGWTTTAPLRALFKLFDDQYGNGESRENRVRQAVALTGKVLEAKPLFCNSSDWIRERFEDLRREKAAYLAHEFFNADWHIEYFKDVAGMLAGAKLRFGASAVPQNSIPQFGLTEEAKKFMGQVEDAVVYQQLWDYFCNTQFRTDYFIKGGMELSEEEQRQLLLGQRFVLSTSPGDVEYLINCGMGTFQMDEQAHGAVVQALAADEHAPKTLARLEDELKGTLRFTQILHILIRLVGKGHVRPCQKKEAAEKVRGRCASMNGEILRRSAVSDRLGCLVSPETGGGVTLSREERLFLFQNAQGAALASPAPEAGPERNAPPVDESFAAKKLPMLRALGISFHVIEGV